MILLREKSFGSSKARLATSHFACCTCSINSASAKRLGSLDIILASAAKQELGLGIFKCPVPQKKVLKVPIPILDNFEF
jgi:hypothetical protein